MLVCEAIWESKRMEVNAQRKECHILGLCFAGCVSNLSREFGLFCTGGPVVFIVVGTLRTLRHPRLRLRPLAPLSFVPTRPFVRSYSHSFVCRSLARISFSRIYIMNYHLCKLYLLITFLKFFFCAHFEDDDECSIDLVANG
jgi:hypothetical protein